MLIILEGSDLSGKTTLAHKLADRIHPRPTILHRGPPVHHVLQEYECDIEHYEPNTDTHIICDRWHLGELVYGPILRGSTALDEPMRRHVSMLLASRGALTVVLQPRSTELRRRYLREGDGLVNLGQVYAARQRYLELQTLMAWQDRIEYREAPTPRWVISQARQAEHGVKHIHDTYVGPPTPRYLLLGDQVNHPNDERHSTAFVPYANTSGHYLLKSLPTDIWMKMGMMNMCEDWSVPSEMYEAWVELGCPRVVALGKHADEGASDAGIPHSHVHHPQHVRRFQFGQSQEYGNLITSKLKAAHG